METLNVDALMQDNASSGADGANVPLALRKTADKVHNRELLEMCLIHFNEPMISFEEVVRCIGYGETGADCYIITRKLGGRIVWNTCVGGYVFLDRLKGQGHVRSSSGEDWDDLTRLDSALSLNGSPREPEFRIELKHDDMEDRVAGS